MYICDYCTVSSLRVGQILPRLCFLLVVGNEHNRHCSLHNLRRSRDSQGGVVGVVISSAARTHLLSRSADVLELPAWLQLHSRIAPARRYSREG